MTHEESMRQMTRCQHCYANVAPTAVAGRWVGIDSNENAIGPSCEYPGNPRLYHKPMPKIEVSR